MCQNFNNWGFQEKRVYVLIILFFATILKISDVAKF